MNEITIRMRLLIILLIGFYGYKLKKEGLYAKNNDLLSKLIIFNYIINLNKINILSSYKLIFKNLIK